MFCFVGRGGCNVNNANQLRPDYCGLAQPLCFCTTNNFVTTFSGCDPIDAITCADGTTCQPGSEGYTCGEQNPPVSRGFVASANRQPFCVGRSARTSFGISSTVAVYWSLLSPLVIGSCFAGEQAAHGVGKPCILNHLAASSPLFHSLSRR